jgi:hypothetical protein
MYRYLGAVGDYEGWDITIERKTGQSTCMYVSESAMANYFITTYIPLAKLCLSPSSPPVQQPSLALTP